MKFHPVQHDLPWPGLSDVERAGADAPLAAENPGTGGAALLPAANPPHSLWAIHVAIGLSEWIRPFRPRVRRAVTARGAGDEPGGRRSLLGSQTPIECHQQGTRRQILTRLVRLPKIDRTLAPTARPRAGGARIAKSTASRHAQRKAAS
ncbi:hypothetical protein [Bradyrhizobium sp. USDA 3315]